MTARPEAQILAETLNSARQLTLFYLKNTDGLDKDKSFAIGEFNTNSIHWMVAHLAWAEDFLVLRGVGNRGLGLEWFEHFKLGSEYPDTSKFPSYEEAFDTLNRVHTQAMELLKTMDDGALEEPNHVGVKFGAGDSKRAIIHHCIRHEGIHCGHIGWLLRMHGRKVI